MDIPVARVRATKDRAGLELGYGLVLGPEPRVKCISQ